MRNDRTSTEFDDLEPEHRDLGPSLSQALTPPPMDELSEARFLRELRELSIVTPASPAGNRIMWVFGGLIAAAAAILLLVVPFTPDDSGPTNPIATASMEPAAPLAGDVDADGQINILDAYLLAMAMDTDGDDTTHDFDEDGTLTASDVEYLANLAVAL